MPTTWQVKQRIIRCQGEGESPVAISIFLAIQQQHSRVEHVASKHSKGMRAIKSILCISGYLLLEYFFPFFFSSSRRLQLSLPHRSVPPHPAGLAGVRKGGELYLWVEFSIKIVFLKY
jgi:hypothetical protein